MTARAGRVQRPWLRRVGDYAGQEQRRRGGAPGGEEQAWSEDDSGEEQVAPGEAEGESDSAESQAADPATGAGDPQEAQDADQTSDPGEARLEVPPEVEQRRREERERAERTALNQHLAPQSFSLEGKYLRTLAAQFARMVSKVAEDSADMPTQGDDEWDLEELRTRRFTGRLVHQCRMTREKRRVAVVLDSSPSCEQQARLFGSIAQVAEALGDCELYDAPNFGIVARKMLDTWENLPEVEREWQFQRRVVLAFGDFDGLERIGAASRVRGNKIYWFCCEERASVLEAQRDQFVKGYKGFYLPATNLAELIQAMRRVR
ncbi:MAG TPA: hypothetical protein VL359_01900 [bacterium]|nr:hypothetical protein [bacterium]